MARFNALLQSLARPPAFQQGLFDAARGIGATPVMLGAQRQAEEERKQLASIYSAAVDPRATPQQISQAVQQLLEKGQTTQALALAQEARTRMSEKEEQGRERGAQGALQFITQGAMRGIPLQSDKDEVPDLQEAVQSALALGVEQNEIIAAYESGLAKPEDIYKVVGNRIFNTKTGDYIEPDEAAESLSVGDLQKVATPESIIKYLKSGEKSDLKAIQEEEDSTEQIASQLFLLDNTLNTVKEAAGLAEEVYPLFYDLAKFAPTTDARKLNNRVDTLKSTLAFDRLQKMRDESKTGGALGNVSNVELGLLGANLAALDPASGDFAQQLKKVEFHYTNFKNALLGKKPEGDRYIELEGILYYVQDDGEYVSLGKL
jgi:hypothetical protein